MRDEIKRAMTSCINKGLEKRRVAVEPVELCHHNLMELKESLELLTDEKLARFLKEIPFYSRLMKEIEDTLTACKQVTQEELQAYLEAELRCEDPYEKGF